MFVSRVRDSRSPVLVVALGETRSLFGTRIRLVEERRHHALALSLFDAFKPLLKLEDEFVDLFVYRLRRSRVSSRQDQLAYSFVRLVRARGGFGGLL